MSIAFLTSTMATRKKLLIHLFLVVACSTTIIAHLARAVEKTSELNSIEKRLATATARFGLDFLKNLNGFDGKNVIFSPLSLQIALNVVLLGTGNKSASQTELEQALGYNSSNHFKADGANSSQVHKAMHSITKSLTALDKNSGEEKLSLKIANLMITEKDKVKLKPDYEKALSTYYDVKMETFSTKHKGWATELEERINSWIKKVTQNLIDKLFSKSDLIDIDAALLLLNAAHFKASWLNKFNSKLTKPGHFHRAGSGAEKSKVKFMLKNIDSDYADLRASSVNCSHHNANKLECKLDCKVLSLPFSANKGSELSMVFLLPHKRDGIANLQSKLDASLLDEVYEAFEKHEVEIKLPKFTFESEIDAEETLQKLGIKEIFTDKANFKSMVGEQNIVSIDKVLHKAKVVVDESGAEAAAVTGVKYIIKSAMISKKIREFHAKHPFLFVIRHNKSNMPLFMGRVSSP